MKQVRRLLLFVRPYWKLAVLSLVLLTSLVVLDLAIPRLIEHLIDDGIKKNDVNVVVQTSLLMLGISLLSALIAIGNNIFSVRTGESVARDLRQAVFLKVQEFSAGNLDQFTTGKLMVRLTSDSSAVQRWVQISLRIGTRAPLLMIGSAILMVNTSSQLALSILPILAVCMGVIVWFSIKMEPLFRTVQMRLDRLNTVLQENIAGARLVKAFGRADHEGQRFEAANQDLTDHTVTVMQFMASMSPALTMFVNIGIVVVVWAGGLQAIQGSLTIGQIVAFTNYLVTTMSPLLMMTNLANVWANGLASMQRIQEVLDAVPDVQPDPHPLPLAQQAELGVAFQDVSFHYNGNQHELALDQINLEARPGQTIAILGATGSGKSTLINLIPRFYDASSGAVKVGGLDVRHLDEQALLEHIGIVPQETILFTGSIRDNIRYGCPQASEQEVIAAAQAAQAHDFILSFPQGYDTHVEERGMNLSGGQKQRIAIARALILRPSILILDDSTSSVDVETETRIQDALQEIMRGRTSFVVAQRISTVLKADRIIVLEHGRVAAAGTHAQLMQSSPIYQEIYASQLGNGLKEAVMDVRNLKEANV
jgi:ATP-binding cassette, subfamily B, multidrug efflux pump